MNKRIIAKSVFVILCITGGLCSAGAQTKLYPQQFDYSEITLNNGVLKKAQDLNYKTLLLYDYKRLLTPFERQAGFTDWVTEHPNFTNWADGTFRLDGHVGGHYLSALALAYASCRDTETKAQLKARMDDMVSEMKKCQDVFADDATGLKGYVGGIPYNDMWQNLYKGDVTEFKQYGGDVPFYVMHKIMAGVRDCYVYGGSETAKTVFIGLCDWAVNVVSKLDDTAMQDILGWEHGGMNEVLLDAYKLTGSDKYLTAAKKFSHKTMVDNMQTLNTSFLDGLHANTQVPKYIGFARIAQEDTSATNYLTAARNFWADVTGNRTVAIGGNSIDEHFLQASKCDEYVNNFDGPESCNSNNMLKLSEDLFASDHDAKYVDFYEKAELNHILSTQNPNTGGYVYFTNLRPLHYRNYSQVNSAMWCCVGTGMENHSKYAEFAFTHSADNKTLYVNLFEPVTLDNNIFGVEQTTGYPYEQGTTIKITKAGTYDMAVRHPSWCKSGYKISVNGTDVGDTSQPGTFAHVNRSWAAGDVVKVTTPFVLRMEELPNVSNYVAFFYGPVLLAANVESALGLDSKTDMTDMYADDGRMGHSPTQGKKFKLTEAPMLIGERADVLKHINVVNADSMMFNFDSSLYDEVNRDKYKSLVLKPFFKTHECRYMMYWNQMTAAEWDSVKTVLEDEEETAERLDNRTVDFVATGEQQSDAGHSRDGLFYTGQYQGEYYISCATGQSFTYKLDTKGLTHNMGLMCRYTTADNGRKGTIYIDGVKLIDVAVKWTGQVEFYNEEYSIPSSYLVDANGLAKTSITVKFSAENETMYPGLYYLRLTKDCIAQVDNSSVSETSFPLTSDGMKLNFWGTNKFDDATKTLYFGGDDTTYDYGDQAGWNFESSPKDFTPYKYLVFALNNNTTGSTVQIRLHDTSDTEYIPMKDNKTDENNIVSGVNHVDVNLTEGSFKKGSDVSQYAFSKVKNVLFWQYWGKQSNAVAFANVFLTNVLPSWDNPVAKTTASGKFGTICLPYVSTLMGGYAYTVKGKSADGSILYLEHYNGLLQAGTPYIYKSISNDGVKFFQIESSEVKATDGSSLFGLSGCLSGQTGLVDDYVYNGEAWQQASTCPANEAYINLNSIDNTTSSGDAQMTISKVATGVDQVDTTVDGSNNATFNVTGARVNNTKDIHHGIYIRNKKKFIVK